MASYAAHKYEEIVTCDDKNHILRKPTSFLSDEEWDLVFPTLERLLYVRNEILQGGAGLAAPQVGIHLPIFIYTPDRATENLRFVINPSFEPVGDIAIEGYEACFSQPLRCIQLKRWEKIKVRYQRPDKTWSEEILEGFAAKVFQHETDHLQGKLTIDHETANVLTFTDPQAFKDYMDQVHLEDSKRYYQAL